MKLSGNTILITGGGSGIGRGLAEALHARGNRVIIAGRNLARLQEVTAQHSGMEAIELDQTDATAVARVAGDLTQRFPELNVLINNAGVSQADDASGAIDNDLLHETLVTNVVGPIRLTSALIEHLKGKEGATIVYTTSGLAFTPLARAAVYSASKAALHSFILSQRYMLKQSGVRVLELAPPYVQTGLGGEQQKTDPRAMPLDDYIAEVMQLLESDADEILVQRVHPLRNNAGPEEHPFVTRFNDMMAGAH